MITGADKGVCLSIKHFNINLQYCRYKSMLWSLINKKLSEKYEISRNACFKQLKIIEEKLYFFEEKLKLYYKKEKINAIIDMINDKKIKKELEDLF